MSTSTLAAPVTHEKTAKESNLENVSFATANNLPMVAITGNTFPIRGVLYAFGGKWDKDAKAWMVPQHKAVEAQGIADKYAPKPKVAKVETVKPAKVSKPVKAKAEKPAHNTDANLILRTETLVEVIGKLADDVGMVAGEDTLLKAAHISIIAARMGIEKALKGLKAE